MDKSAQKCDDYPREFSCLKKKSLPYVMDEEYSVDGFIEELKRKNLKSFGNIPDAGSAESPRRDCRGSLQSSTNTKDLPILPKEMTYLELRDLFHRRLSDARFDVVENKIDRVITSLKNGESSEDETHLLKLMLERIRDLEKKLDQKTTRKDYVDLSLDPLIDGYFHPYSTYVVEKATQTPSKDHNCEGVYVLVSKSNNQKVHQVHRNFKYVLDEDIADCPHPRGGFYYVRRKATQPKTRKVIRRYGYPEYVFEESHGSHPIWDRGISKTIAFLPPIPDPYAKRRPRYY